MKLRARYHLAVLLWVIQDFFLFLLWLKACWVCWSFQRICFNTPANYLYLFPVYLCTLTIIINSFTFFRFTSVICLRSLQSLMLFCLGIFCYKFWLELQSSSVLTTLVLLWPNNVINKWASVWWSVYVSLAVGDLIYEFIPMMQLKINKRRGICVVLLVRGFRRFREFILLFIYSILFLIFSVMKRSSKTSNCIN